MKSIESLEACELCFPGDKASPQFGIILKNLLCLLKKKKAKLQFQKLDILGNQTSFYQLLKCIFEHTSSFSKISWECNHNLLQYYIRKNLQIQQQCLQGLSECLFLSITKRRYEFEVIKTLTKNMPRTIVSSRQKDIQKLLKDNLIECSNTSLTHNQQEKKKKENNVKFGKKKYENNIENVEYKNQKKETNKYFPERNNFFPVFQSNYQNSRYQQKTEGSYGYPVFNGQIINYPFNIPEYIFPCYKNTHFLWAPLHPQK